MYFPKEKQQMVLLFIYCEFGLALFQVVVELEYDGAAGHAN